MKRLISILAVLCIFSLLIIPVSAEIYFCFTPDSSLVPGGKLQVDVEAMSAYDETLKKAWQTGKVRFEWYENGVLMPNETTDTLHFTQEHVGKAYSVWVIIPEFSLECPPIEVQKAVFSTPVQPMQDGTAGQPYYTKIICTIADAVYTVYEKEGGPNDFDKTGLTLASDGTLEGTPAQAGTFGFTVLASGAAKEMYMEYTLTILPSEETTAPETTAPTDASLETLDISADGEGIDISLDNPGDGEADDAESGESSADTVVYILCGVAAVAVIAAVLLLLKKKK